MLEWIHIYFLKKFEIIVSLWHAEPKRRAQFCSAPPRLDSHATEEKKKKKTIWHTPSGWYLSYPIFFYPTWCLFPLLRFFFSGFITPVLLFHRGTQRLTFESREKQWRRLGGSVRLWTKILSSGNWTWNCCHKLTHNPALMHTHTCTHIDKAKNNIKNTTTDCRDMENNNNKSWKNTHS